MRIFELCQHTTTNVNILMFHCTTWYDTVWQGITYHNTIHIEIMFSKSANVCTCDSLVQTKYIICSSFKMAGCIVATWYETSVLASVCQRFQQVSNRVKSVKSNTETIAEMLMADIKVGVKLYNKSSGTYLGTWHHIASVISYDAIWNSVSWTTILWDIIKWDVMLHYVL